MLLGRVRSSTPQRLEALPYPCDWEYGGGGKTRKLQLRGRAPQARISNGRGKKKRERGVRMDLNLKRGTRDFRSNYRKLLSHPCCRQSDGAIPTTWAATLAPGHAGANNTGPLLSFQSELTTLSLSFFHSKLIIFGSFSRAKTV